MVVASIDRDSSWWQGYSKSLQSLTIEQNQKHRKHRPDKNRIAKFPFSICLLSQIPAATFLIVPHNREITILFFAKHDLDYEYTPTHYQNYWARMGKRYGPPGQRPESTDAVMKTLSTRTESPYQGRNRYPTESPRQTPQLYGHAHKSSDKMLISGLFVQSMDNNNNMNH